MKKENIFLWLIVIVGFHYICICDVHCNECFKWALGTAAVFSLMVATVVFPALWFHVLKMILNRVFKMFSFLKN